MQIKLETMEQDALIKENYQGNFPRQMPIYLIVDWQTGEIKADPRSYNLDGTSVREWNGYEHSIRLPNDVDAERLASDIDQYYKEKLDAVRSGWSEHYDGNNNKGTLSEDAQEFLMGIDRDIENGEYLSLIDEERFTDYLLQEGIIDEEGN